MFSLNRSPSTKKTLYLVSQIGNRVYTLNADPVFESVPNLYSVVIQRRNQVIQELSEVIQNINVEDIRVLTANSKSFSTHRIDLNFNDVSFYEKFRNLIKLILSTDSIKFGSSFTVDSIFLNGELKSVVNVLIACADKHDIQAVRGNPTAEILYSVDGVSYVAFIYSNLAETGQSESDLVEKILFDSNAYQAVEASAKNKDMTYDNDYNLKRVFVILNPLITTGFRSEFEFVDESIAYFLNHKFGKGAKFKVYSIKITNKPKVELSRLENSLFNLDIAEIANVRVDEKQELLEFRISLANGFEIKAKAVVEAL